MAVDPVSQLGKHLINFKRKIPLYANLWAYYEGEQPLVYSADRLREVFPNIDADFTQNWCLVVVDALLDRIILQGFEVVDDVPSTDEMIRQFNLMQLDLLSQQVHLGMLVCGESFLVAVPQENVLPEDRQQWEGEEPALYVFPNDPASCDVIYSSRNPNMMLSAAKWWEDDEDGRIHVELYTAEAIYYFRSKDRKESISELNDAGSFTLEGAAENTIGRIPVFHFRNRLRRSRGELRSVIPIQDSINKLNTDMLIAAEFAAFKQKWIISNADIDLLRTSPGEIWDLPAGDGFGGETKVGEFTETNLMNYLGPLEREVSALATITRTPPHYFGGFKMEISGEALKVLEGPLVRKAERYQQAIRDAWRQICQMALKASRSKAPKLEDIDVTFGSAQAQQPLYDATVLKTNREAGIPLITQLRTQGWTQKAINQLKADQEEEQTQAVDNALRIAEQSRTNFDRGEGGRVPSTSAGSSGGGAE